MGKTKRVLSRGTPSGRALQIVRMCAFFRFVKSVGQVKRERGRGTASAVEGAFFALRRRISAPPSGNSCHLAREGGFGATFLLLLSAFFFCYLYFLMFFSVRCSGKLTTLLLYYRKNFFYKSVLLLQVRKIFGQPFWV